MVKAQYALQSASRLAASSPSANLANLLSTAPQIVTSPISYTIVNLIPFNQPVYVNFIDTLFQLMTTDYT